MIRIRPARYDDSAALAAKLRAADVQEIRAHLGQEPLTVLDDGIASSAPCYAVVDGSDVVIALFGVVPDRREADVGLVWLLASDELHRHPFFVLRNSRKWVELLQEKYRVLWNHIDARNELHIRWLQWSGFTLLQLIEKFGVEQRPFYEFERVRRQMVEFE
jgi:hypothetical protein